MSTSTVTVTVACRLPNGLRLRLFTMQDSSEPVLGGGSRTVKMARDTGDEFVLNGWSHPQNRAPHCDMADGFALTPNVPKEFWDKWYSQNKDTAFIKQGLIFAHEKKSSVEAEALEKKDVRSGLERLDPDAMPRGIQKSDLVKTAA